MVTIKSVAYGADLVVRKVATAGFPEE